MHWEPEFQVEQQVVLVALVELVQLAVWEELEELVL